MRKIANAAMQRIHSTSVRWRVPLVLGGVALFIVGLGLSIPSLDLTLDQLTAWPVILIFALLAPLTLSLAAVTLQQAARVAGRRIEFHNAFAVSAIGNVAEILPLPGGAMVRGAALMRAGAGLSETTFIVTLMAILTLAMASVLAGIPLLLHSSVTGYAFLAGGIIGSLLSIILIARRAGLGVAAAMIATRLAILAVGVVRVTAAFAAISVAITPLDAGLFVVSTTLGSAIAIVPAGLGVSEAIAAALASLAAIPPAAAFIAVALNRIVGLTMSGAIVLVFTSTIKLAKMRN